MSDPNPSRLPRRRFLRHLAGRVATVPLLLDSIREVQADETAKPLVDLDARDSSAGTETWNHAGTLGAFRRVGQPTVGTIGGVRAVRFDGRQDAYVGPPSVPALEGSHARTIEVWAFNPSIDSPEETMVAWGRRGGPDAADMAFNYGHSGAYGAATHWANDLGWNGVPKANQWHHLVYTYDGATARIYDNGVEKNNRALRLNTAPGNTINLAVQNGADGHIQFVNEFDRTQQAGSLWLAAVRIYSIALSADEIEQRFARDAQRFGAVAPFSGQTLLKQGTLSLETDAFALHVLRATQTAASLAARFPAFDYLPQDRLSLRLGENFAHLGDITFRVRSEGGAWQSFATATNREGVKPLAAPGLPMPAAPYLSGVPIAADLTPALGAACPLTVERLWLAVGSGVGLRFRLTNHTSQPVELGAFGAAMVFNNILTNRSLEEAHKKCAFADPYIGGEAGYLQVTRLNGKGPVLLVLPEKGTAFEAYRPLRDDPTPRDVTFEGFYEWMVHTRAYAENEWKNAAPWNPPTSRVLIPGETITYGFRFALAPSIREIEATLMSLNRPVVVGIPGYVLPTDQVGKLFVRTNQSVKSIAVEPGDALHIQAEPGTTSAKWHAYRLTGRQSGRCRLRLTYADGLTQYVHYNVILPEAEQVKRLGEYHARKQWYADPADPFGRTNSFMPVSRETGKIVLQHSHTWMVGLSDEMGAGPSVAVAMKNLGQSNAREIELLEKYVSATLWGKLQTPDYGVRASLFYYEPNLHPNYYTIRSGWDRARTETKWRAFNYPHVACVYWSLYRLARNHTGLVKTQTWDWYLRQAYRTVMAMQAHCGRRVLDGLAQFGLMVGSVHVEILRDLRREGWQAEADNLEAYMRQRAEHWKSLRYPFGSEMPWDSTGQEEVYSWCRYFAAEGYGKAAKQNGAQSSEAKQYDEKAQVTVDAILGYMPTLPNWAYNGAARRYFDAPVNGTRWPEIGRMTNHYGAALNAIPVLDDYRRHATDLYRLRVGYAGMNSVVANIAADGHGSYGFDATPAILQFDPYTADYGIAFYGYAQNTGAYVIHDAEFGWLGFGCGVTEEQGKIKITPRDAFGRQVFFAPFHLALMLDAGQFKSVEVSLKAQTVQCVLAPANAYTPAARLRIETPSGNQDAQREWKPDGAYRQEREAYVVPLANETMTTVTVRGAATDR